MAADLRDALRRLEEVAAAAAKVATVAAREASAHAEAVSEYLRC